LIKLFPYPPHLPQIEVMSHHAQAMLAVLGSWLIWMLKLGKL